MSQWSISNHSCSKFRCRSQQEMEEDSSLSRGLHLLTLHSRDRFILRLSHRLFSQMITKRERICFWGLREDLRIIKQFLVEISMVGLDAFVVTHVTSFMTTSTSGSQCRLKSWWSIEEWRQWWTSILLLRCPRWRFSLSFPKRTRKDEFYNLKWIGIKQITYHRSQAFLSLICPAYWRGIAYLFDYPLFSVGCTRSKKRWTKSSHPASSTTLQISLRT